MKSIGRNDICPCGSGKKYKLCCLQNQQISIAIGHANATGAKLHIPTAIQSALKHQQAGELHQALAIGQQILEVSPNHTEALNFLGVIAYQLGKIDMAVAYMQKAIALEPGSVSAHNNLGNIFHAQGKLDEADACYRRTLSLKPDHANAHSNLGNVLQEQGKLDEALTCYQKALSLKPDHADAYNNLGNVFQKQGLLDKAASCYHKALELKPDFADAHNNLGNVFHEQGRLDEAVACFRKALSFKPNYVNAHNNLGIAFQEQGRLDEAVACFHKVLELEPGYYTARIQLLHQLQRMCEWKDMVQSIQAVRQAVHGPLTKTKNRISPFLFLALPGTPAAEQKQCAEAWVQSTYQAHIPLREKLGFDFKREPSQKINLGYLSADFLDHPVAQLMAEVFELHDRNRFHITAYSYGPDDGSLIRKRLEKAFDQFVDVRDSSYEEAAKIIYDDRTDILIDLTGYTRHSRSAILALRPAPIQVNYLGYPGTMGADFVDYLIADRFIIPPEQHEHYTEKVVWLPDCYMPRDDTPPRLAAPHRQDCGLPEDGIVFCCFNQTFKITMEVFDIWCRLLKAVPGSVLWLPASNPYAEANLKQEAETRGIDTTRLIKAPRLDLIEEHYARLQCADLFLDTVPYNAHTTCSDALWVGLPVVTCSGETFSSRVAGSLLTSIGMTELIANNLEDYYKLALDLATDKKKREKVRNKIIASRNMAPLFDSTRFVRNLESAYEDMLEKTQRNHIQ